MRKRLVFRVDDVGYTPAYDMGAFKAFECGIASSADVMFDSPDTVAALNWLKDKPWSNYVMNYFRLFLIQL